MKYCKAIILIFSVLIFESSYSQTQTISSDSIIINVTVTTQSNKKLETEIIFENLSSHQKKIYKSNKEGRVDCVLSTCESYQIKIPNSTDSYEYNIPEFSISPLQLTFKFSINKNPTSSLVIRFLNNSTTQNKFILKSKSSSSAYKLINDTVNIELSTSDEYSIIVNEVVIKNNSIITQDRKSYNYILNFLDTNIAELIQVEDNKTAINVVFSNLKGMPVKDEVILIKGKNSRSENVLKTSKNGTALTIVPATDEYEISLNYFPNVFTLDTKKEQNVIYTNTVRLKYPSSKEFEDQLKEDSIRITKRDSLYVKYEKSFEVRLASIKTQIESQASSAIIELVKDPKYFERVDNEICAVLYRNKYIWKRKFIVTDVTGSMFPYMKQLALWHLLELMNKDSSDYIFFNDGDNMPDYAKKIGKTGGIYYNLNKNPDSVIKTMDKAIFNGSGGDAPENNIEALLKAVELNKNKSQIILIADNFSPVKDMVLLKELKVPVRVIVCGSKFGYIHRDYLEIAYKTQGSIHTIEEDINNLSNLHNDDTITIAGKTYKFIQGRFFPIS